MTQLKQLLKDYTSVIVLFTILSFTACGTKKHTPAGVEQPTKLSKQFGVRITPEDNLRLYTEASKWLGVKHKYGGNTKSGVDCSGFVLQVYREVYGKSLYRSSADMLNRNCRKVKRDKLSEGDLVFFNTAGNQKKTPNHVGIYLKNGRFVHTSTSKGVMVSSLSEPYYIRTWITGGRVK